MNYTSETHTINGAKVETGTVSFQGQDFSALGSIIDEEQGIICGYPSERSDPNVPRFVDDPKRAQSGVILMQGRRFVLTAWNGSAIAPLKLTGTWINRNTWGGVPVKMYAWSCVFNGRKYVGRNAGAGMFVRMRANKTSK